eukprot:Em0021g183a
MEGKEANRRKDFSQEYGEGTAVTLRLTKEYYGIGRVVSFLDPLEHYAVMYKCEDDTISTTTDSKISWQYRVIVSAVSPGGSRLCMGLAQSMPADILFMD